MKELIKEKQKSRKRFDKTSEWKEKFSWISFLIEKEDIKKLNEYCEDIGVKRSELLRSIVKEFIENRKS